MSDNIDDILKLKSTDQHAIKSAHLRMILSTEFNSSGFVVFLQVLAWLTVISAFFVFIQYNQTISAFICFGSAMSLFISAHVIKTIEKCAFYLENSYNKKSGWQK